jgi:hypothetical protein
MPFAPTSEMKPPQVAALLEQSARGQCRSDRFLEKLQAFEMELYAQHLTPIQTGT